MWGVILKKYIIYLNGVSTPIEIQYEVKEGEKSLIDKWADNLLGVGKRNLKFRSPNGTQVAIKLEAIIAIREEKIKETTKTKAK